ncbi:hypothetical protein M3Y98_00964700 [Aphelenchoides besseyi]|nr:hypothetical protein M3Y98_00964700 [Aphelenchoides besseyi]KAI6194721.1 hypothetical protein M3Y96_01154700 [Aphelenchoides besseyi]
MKPSDIPKSQKRIHRMSSNDWETHVSDKSLAEIVNNPQQFRAKIHLNQFNSFEQNEIDIHATKENHSNPNRPLRVLNRQYRLPDDIDLNTIQLKRNESEVDVKAKKILAGASLMLDITDVTATAQRIQRVRAF